MWVVTHRADKRGVQDEAQVADRWFLCPRSRCFERSRRSPAGEGEARDSGETGVDGDTLQTEGHGCAEGKLTSATAGSLAMDVSQANRWGRAWATLGTATVVVDDTTKVRRNGKNLMTDLVVGDRMLVQARACKADLTAETAPALTGVRVVAHPAKA